MTDPQDTIRRLVWALDAALPLLDKAAAAEVKREAGKTMRECTEQSRAKHLRKMVTDVAKEWGIEL